MDRAVLVALQSRSARAAALGHAPNARLGAAAAGGGFPCFRSLSWVVALCQPARPAAHRPRRRGRRRSNSGRARDAAHDFGRAAQRAHPLPAGADPLDGGQPLHLPRVERASALQPARRTWRACAHPGRRRSGRAPREGAHARAQVAHCGPARRRSGQAGPPPSQHQCIGPDFRAAAVGKALRRAHGDSRPSVRRARSSPSRGRALRGGGSRSADGALIRRPDQRPLAADHHSARRARRPSRPRSRRARQCRTGRLARRPRGDGDGSRRIDRRGAVLSDRAIQASAARAVRSFRIRPLSDSTAVAGRLSRTCRSRPSSATSSTPR